MKYNHVQNLIRKCRQYFSSEIVLRLNQRCDLDREWCIAFNNILTKEKRYSSLKNSALNPRYSCDCFHFANEKTFTPQNNLRAIYSNALDEGIFCPHLKCRFIFDFKRIESDYATSIYQQLFKHFVHFLMYLFTSYSQDTDRMI